MGLNDFPVDEWYCPTCAGISGVASRRAAGETRRVQNTGVEAAHAPGLDRTSQHFERSRLVSSYMSRSYAPSRRMYQAGVSSSSSARDARTGVCGKARPYINMGQLSEESMKHGVRCLNNLRDRHARLDLSKQIRPRIRNRGRAGVLNADLSDKSPHTAEFSTTVQNSQDVKPFSSSANCCMRSSQHSHAVTTSPALMTQCLQECSRTPGDSKQRSCHDSHFTRQCLVQTGAVTRMPSSTPTPERHAGAVRHRATAIRCGTEQAILQPEGEWVRHENPYKRKMFVPHSQPPESPKGSQSSARSRSTVVQRVQGAGIQAVHGAGCPTRAVCADAPATVMFPQRERHSKHVQSSTSRSVSQGISAQANLGKKRRRSCDVELKVCFVVCDVLLLIESCDTLKHANL